jgi:HK97 gp10 family phage protein
VGLGADIMARFAFKAGDEYAIKLSRLVTNHDEIAKKAIYGAVKIVADKIKSNLEGVLSDEATGELVDSFGVTPIDKDKQGNWNAKIGFDGYDSEGVPNQLKARVLESGSSKQKKRPFVRPAMNATKKQARAKMEQIIEEEYKKIFR